MGSARHSGADNGINLMLVSQFARMFFGDYFGILKIQDGGHFFNMAVILTIQIVFEIKMYLFGGCWSSW